MELNPVSVNFFPVGPAQLLEAHRASLLLLEIWVGGGPSHAISEVAKLGKCPHLHAAQAHPAWLSVGRYIYVSLRRRKRGEEERGQHRL